ncbi:MAG: anthranilate synthase component I family protein [Candidatus Comchoanobacterales bacterium]
MFFKELPYSESRQWLHRFGDEDKWVWLDRTSASETYEYVCFWPYSEQVLSYDQMSLATHYLRQGLLPLQPRLCHLPPFQGGCIGLWHYDAGVDLDIKRCDHPSICLRWYDVVMAWDHHQKRCFLVSTGAPEADLEKKAARAQKRLDQALSWLALPYSIPTIDKPSLQFTESLGRQGYIDGVKLAQQWIRSGHLFELNLTQSWVAPRPSTWSSLSCYLDLRQKHQAPMSAYWSGNQAVLSFSPERFVQVTDGWIQTHPIKGTIQRHSDPIIDQNNKDILKRSTKDIAENAMIVDLMRHDLSLLCEPESVQVDGFCVVKTHAFVHHLVSSVKGRLIDPEWVVEVMARIFPAGSISGAPKAKAIELIDRLEALPRGPYTGCLGVFSTSGDMDSSVLIRSVTVDDHHIACHAGGAVTLLSKPEEEYHEACVKAQALVEALSGESS